MNGGHCYVVGTLVYRKIQSIYVCMFFTIEEKIQSLMEFTEIHSIAVGHIRIHYDISGMPNDGHLRQKSASRFELHGCDILRKSELLST